MKLPLILTGAVTSVVVFGAVIGSAATLTNTVPALGANTASVASCDSTVTTAWDTTYEATIGAYKVTNVTVSSLDGVACDGATLKVTLTATDNSALGTEKDATVAEIDTEKVLDFSADNIDVADAANVSVVLVSP